MDLVESYKKLIEEKRQELENIQKDDHPDRNDIPMSAQMESQSYSEGYFTDQDKNLNKILDQQTHLKRIIDQDNNIQMCKNLITKTALEIEDFRKNCMKSNEEALRNKQELAQDQAKELEKYQMNQIRSITDDYNRHLEILEQRKKEIQSLHKEIEREQNERDAYLADVEKKLDRQLQERQRAIKGGSLPFPSSSNNTLTDELNNPSHIELTSVDEYAPYGAAPHSRVPPATRSSGAGRGRGRGRRRRG